jgi:hypothetical protein
MAVDNRLKRQSATCILNTFVLSSVFPSAVGVTQDERQAVSWAYSGITALGVVPTSTMAPTEQLMYSGGMVGRIYE